jgi:hypothetical protein
MKAQVRKIIRDYTYHMESLEDAIEISGEAEIGFRDAMSEEHEDSLKALSSNETDASKKIETEDSVNFEDRDFKKIFRKLAVKCHPDKLLNNMSERESIFLKECYSNINKANDTYDWGLLLKVALDLEVEIPDLSSENINNINKNIEDIRDKINRYESSMAYKWYTLSDPEIKKGYLKTCAAIFNKSLSGN